MGTRAWAPKHLVRTEIGTPQGRERGWGPGHGDLREKDQDRDNLGCTRYVGDSWMMLLSMTPIPYPTHTKTLHYMVNIITHYLNLIQFWKHLKPESYNYSSADDTGNSRRHFSLARMSE